MSIKTWPARERPREKLLTYGESALSDEELLAIFLHTGVKGKSAVQLARELMANFGQLQRLFDLDLAEFCALDGLGPAKFAMLKAALEISRRYFFERAKRSIPFSNSDDTKKYLLAQLSHRKQEVFACLFLDNKNKIISYEELFFGSIDRTEVYPREIIRVALKQNARSIIIAHNHTSGDPNPSTMDIQFTRHLYAILKLVDISLLDHIIVGQSQAISLVERGQLSH